MNLTFFFGVNFHLSVPLLLSKETDSEVGRNQNCKNHKRKQPEKKEKMAKDLKNLSQVPINNKRKNADTLNGDLNMANTATNKKKIQTATSVKNELTEKLLKNCTEKSTRQQNDSKAHNSASNEDTLKTKKSTYNKKGTTKILERINKTNVNK